MAGTVNGIFCNAVRAKPGKQSPQTRIETYSPAGVDGYGSRRVGIGDAPFGFECFLQDTQANVEAWYQNIIASKTTTITIVDDWGTTHTNMQITQVGALRRIPAIRGSLSLVSGVCQISGVQAEVAQP